MGSKTQANIIQISKGKVAGNLQLRWEQLKIKGTELVRSVDFQNISLWWVSMNNMKKKKKVRVTIEAIGLSLYFGSLDKLCKS